MSKSTTQFDKLMKETTDFGTQYSDACTKSSAIFMKGVEDIIGTVMSLAQSSAEKQANFVKEAMGSKTINEFAEVQNKIVQANFDDFMAGATKISEIGVKVLTDSAEPVNTEINKAVQKATQAMAA
ncbi:MAG: phasin family protein [Alcanivorax sp.]